MFQLWPTNQIKITRSFPAPRNVGATQWRDSAEERGEGTRIQYFRLPGALQLTENLRWHEYWMQDPANVSCTVIVVRGLVPGGVAQLVKILINWRKQAGAELCQLDLAWFD